MATPRSFNGHKDVVRHSVDSRDSAMTSWSTSLNLAQEFAQSERGYWAILKTDMDRQDPNWHDVSGEGTSNLLEEEFIYKGGTLWSGVSIHSTGYEPTGSRLFGGGEPDIL